MIINKNIELKINGYNIRTYKEKFPNIEKGDIIVLNQVNDISPRSTVEVECLCSNIGCKKKYFRPRRNIHTETTYCSDICRGEHVRYKNSLFRKDKILEKFRLRIVNNESIKYKDIKTEDPSLLYEIDRYYPMNEILRDLNIHEEDYVNTYGLSRNVNSRTLSEKEIVKRLDHLKSMGRLTTSAMRTEFTDLRLETSIKKIYGSVEECFSVLGYERDIYSNSTLIKMGREFEAVFKDILEELDIYPEYQKPLSNGYIPDFRLREEDTIIDAKLSSWTTSIPEDIQKYSQHCKKLLFVYLREGSSLPTYSSNVKLVSVYYYTSMLNENKKEHYESKLKNILSYHPQP